MKPLARTEGLLKQVVGSETLVYNRADATSCCLNPLLSAVWRQCDGTHTVEQIAELVASEMTLPTDVEPTMIIEQALVELEEHNLMLVAFDPATAHDKKRREILKAAAMIPLFPGIQRILAPTAANAVSGPVTSTSLTESVTASSTGTVGVSPTRTGTIAATASNTGSIAATASATGSIAATASATGTVTATASATASATRTPAVSLSRSV